MVIFAFNKYKEVELVKVEYEPMNTILSLSTQKVHSAFNGTLL
jgi:hypothetical protein